jgi:hypothetical protein
VVLRLAMSKLDPDRARQVQPLGMVLTRNMPTKAPY